MAKAKGKKISMTDARLNALSIRITELSNVVARNNYVPAIVGTVGEAICPRVAARLTALERELMTKTIGRVLGKSPHLAADFTPPKMQAPDLRPWPPSALYKLAADMVSDQERGSLERAFELAKRISRAARHELIVKLTDLNRGA